MFAIRIMCIADMQTVRASERIVATLEEFFMAEKISSVSDFGAGVGQYAWALKKRMPNLLYYGYDGAGDVVDFTNGLLKYADLTKPLELPVTEWVLSTEVGEHIPSKFEGMYLRNLHRHNCMGIIMSWGVLGQGGSNHINLHSNAYVSRVMTELGYFRDTAVETKLRNPDLNYWWFTKSCLVFRRNNPTCRGVH
jgi:hypothetical protein